MRLKIFCGLLLISFVGMIMNGCMAAFRYAGYGLLEAQQAVRVAQGMLQTLDEVYDNLLALRGDGERQQAATRALAVADAAAIGIRQVLQGEAVDDARLNVLAGQVDGVQALAKELKR